MYRWLRALMRDGPHLSGSPGRALGDQWALTPQGTRRREAHHKPQTPHLCSRLRRPLYDVTKGAVSAATVACGEAKQ